MADTSTVTNVPSDRTPLSSLVQKDSETRSDTPKENTEFKDAHSFMDDLEYHRVADFFDIDYEDRKDPKIYEKLDFLREWAKIRSKSEERIDQLTALDSVRKGLGWQFKGKELVTRLHRYARLDQDRQRIEKEMALL